MGWMVVYGFELGCYYLAHLLFIFKNFKEKIDVLIKCHCEEGAKRRRSNLVFARLLRSLQSLAMTYV